jgi:hypothetical protein
MAVVVVMVVMAAGAGMGLDDHLALRPGRLKLDRHCGASGAGRERQSHTEA